MEEVDGNKSETERSMHISPSVDEDDEIRNTKMKMEIFLMYSMKKVMNQSYFKVPKDVRINTTHFFIMKIPNKRELEQIAINHSSDINTKDFIKIYKKFTDEPYSFLVNDTTLPSDNPLRFRKNLYSV